MDPCRGVPEIAVEKPYWSRTCERRNAWFGKKRMTRHHPKDIIITRVPGGFWLPNPKWPCNPLRQAKHIGEAFLTVTDGFAVEPLEKHMSTLNTCSLGADQTTQIDQLDQFCCAQNLTTEGNSEVCMGIRSKQLVCCVIPCCVHKSTRDCKGYETTICLQHNQYTKRRNSYYSC